MPILQKLRIEWARDRHRIRRSVPPKYRVSPTYIKYDRVSHSQPDPMRRDTIFYKLFQTSPTLLFDLLGTTPTYADQYRFDSVAIKEAKFEIDGVFLPPEDQAPGTVYFCEVQFQRDDQLYERLFGESFLYFYRQRSRFCDWQAAIIYPSRTIE